MEGEEYKHLQGLVNIVPKNASVQGLKQLHRSFLVTADVHVKIIINETEAPFITSDYPVVRYNQFYEQFASTKSTGFGTVGLQLILPLSPKYALLFYDQQVYNVGSRKGKTVKVTKGDVEQLNLLQMVNCFAVVVGNEKVTESYFKSLYTKAGSFKRPNELRSITTGNINEPNGSDITFKFHECRTKLYLSFVSFSTYASRFKFAPDNIQQLRKHSAFVSDALEKSLLEGF